MYQQCLSSGLFFACIYVYVCVYVHICTCVYIYMYVYVYVYMYMCMCMCVCQSSEYWLQVTHVSVSRVRFPSGQQ